MDKWMGHEKADDRADYLEGRIKVINNELSQMQLNLRRSKTYENQATHLASQWEDQYRDVCADLEQNKKEKAELQAK